MGSEGDVLDEFVHLEQSIPTLDDTPLLADLVDRMRGPAVADLGRFDALFIQHQLANQVPMARALVELGLPAERITWLDVPYTSHARTREALTRQVGIRPEQFVVCDDFRVTRPYAPYQLHRVQTFVKRWLARDERDRRPLLVLDDGAYFLEALATYRIDDLPDVRVVEQTSRGYKKMDGRLDLGLLARRVPIVDVARSAVKKTLEPPFIGLSVVASLQLALERLGATEPATALVLGYGSIGTEVARFLCSEHPGTDVSVWDTDATRREAAALAGHRLHRPLEAGRYELIVGCSGRASFRPSDWPLIAPGGTAVLASGSSGSVELSRRDFIELAESEPHDTIELATAGLDQRDIHADLHFALPQGRRATFVNAGFPLNFDGRVSCVPIPLIEPTMAMMVRGALQAAAAPVGAAGPIELDAAFCAALEQEFLLRIPPHLAALVPVSAPPLQSA